MDNIISDKYTNLDKAITYVKQYLNDIVLLLVVKMKSSYNYQDQYDVATEFFSEEELSDYIEAFDMLGIYHDISYGEDDFIHKINCNYFDKYKHKYIIVFNTTGSKRIRSKSALIPAVCEMIGFKYASSDIMTCSILENKIHANSLLDYHGFPVPSSWYFYPKYGWMGNAPAHDQKLIIKPCSESASIGITQKSVGYYSNEFESLVHEVCDTLREPVIVQEFIDGWEVEVPILYVEEKIALPPMGIELNKAKYLKEKFLSFEMVFSDDYDYYRFDQINPKVAQQLQKIAEDSSRILDLRGTVRADFRVNDKGQCFITDYNNSPHLTRFHSVAKSLMSLGFQYADLFCLILYNALNDHIKNHSIFEGQRTNRLF